MQPDITGEISNRDIEMYIMSHSKLQERTLSTRSRHPFRRAKFQILNVDSGLALLLVFGHA